MKLIILDAKAANCNMRFPDLNIPSDLRLIGVQPLASHRNDLSLTSAKDKFFV